MCIFHEKTYSLTNFFQIDMCAAPGSKTAQLIEAIHAVEDVVPKGKKILIILFKNRFRM